MRKVVGIGLLRPSTLPQVIVEFSNVGLLIPANFPLVIAEDMLLEVDLGHKIPANITLAIG